jgi:hypothetical protein
MCLTEMNAIKLKSRSKYALRGEKVEIVTPKEFVRCGYPLSIKGIMQDQFKEVEKDCGRMFAALVKKPIPPDVPDPDPSDDFAVDSWLTLTALEVPNMSATVHGMLCAAAAAWRLEEANFGGKERRVFEQDSWALKVGQVVEVLGRKLVKTGIRYPSRVYRSGWDGEADYEPGGLESEKTHCVYKIRAGSQDTWILAANCRRLLDVSH